MTALVALLGLMYLTIWLGRLIQRVTAWTYILVAFISLIQVVAVLIVMYGMEPPEV